MSWLTTHLMTRRSLLKAASATGIAAATLPVATGCKRQPVRLAIVHTNDTHGHDLLNEESLGLAAASQLRTDYEGLGYEVLLLDAGDATQGENLVNHSQGDAAIDFLNTAGYDALCLGNHEFDFGQHKIADYVEQAHFPILSANTYVDATGERLVEPRTTFELSDGTKVGVFGLTTPETYTKTNPLRVQGLTFLAAEELYTCAQEQADALRAGGCDLVVCLAHLGELDESAPNRAIDVVAHTTGIDLVIDGHDHLEEERLVRNADGADVLVVEAGCYTHAVGVVTWDQGTLTSRIETFGTYGGQDTDVAAHIREVADGVDAELADVVASTRFPLDGERAPGVRTHETNLGDLVADAVLWEAEQMADDRPDCAILNGGTVRQSLPVGDISVGNVLNVIPYINDVCTLRVSGAQLLEALEASCAAAPEEMGGFPQVSGMRLSIDTRVPYAAGSTYPNSTYAAPAKPGSRVRILDVGGRGFDLKDTYTIASSDFLCAGGDTYYVFAEAASTTMKSIGYLVSDCLQYYLLEACGGTVPEEYADPAGQGRIELLS